MGISLEEKKRLQKISNILVAVAILLVVGTVGIMMARQSSNAIEVIALLVGSLCWLAGLGYYGMSKGYSVVIGILCGIFHLLGLIVLLCLPDKNKIIAEARKYDSPTNYPRGQEAMLYQEPPTR